MSIKNIEDSILIEMCGNDSEKYAGFHSIVTKLITTGYHTWSQYGLFLHELIH